MLADTYSALTLVVLSTCALLSVVIDSLQTSFPCPHKCFCNTLSRIVYCSRRGLQTIPTDISASAVQLNLNGNAFQTRRIERDNLTALTRLEHLYMSDCAIERIAVDAFVDLTSLQWLDLSNNRIKVLLVVCLYVNEPSSLKYSMVKYRAVI